MRVRRSLLLIVFLFVSVPLLADRPAIPTLHVESDDGTVALELTALDIRVTIRGHLARTEYELTYHNSLDRVTGGYFRFPLPADAEVTDLGLYFDGKLRHGVAVERVLARAAYEETVHRSVDPALAEWSAGRGFQLSIFPIPANGEKKVVIAYDQELTNGDYVLDLRYGRAMKLNLTIDAEGRTQTVEGSIDGQVIDGIVRIARETKPEALLARSPEDGFWYASAAIDIDAPATEMTPAAHVVIFYDTSSSSVQQNAAVLRSFLTAFLARQQAWATADVIPFHITLEARRRIEKAGMPAGQHEVERALAELQPFGATNLLAVVSQLQDVAQTLPPSTRLVLVTDGLTSLGDSRDVAAAIAKLTNLRRPLLVVHAANEADDQLLANAARATGGWYIDLTRDLTRTEPAAAAASAMRVPARVRLSGSEVVPESLLVAQSGRFTVAARAKEALVKLPRELPLRELRDSREASMIRRAWARAKLHELIAGGASDEQLIAHGRAFTQLTPRTSLLVLESWWDYEQYGIDLPPDVAEAKERDQARSREAERQRQLSPPPAPAPPPPPPPPPVMKPGMWGMSGRVLDNVQNPLPGVTVTLLDGETTIAEEVTDANGWFAVFAPQAPREPRLHAELTGYAQMERAFNRGMPNGLSVDLVMPEPTVSETITVTATAPIVDVQRTGMASTLPSLRAEVITTDQLLNSIARESVSEDADPNELAAAQRHRIELSRAVVAKLRAISSTSERVRYYLSARALLGGDKSFHVFAAEAFRERSPEIAARVLSDLAEARPDDAPLLRILARVLDGWNEPELARLLLRRAIELSPAETQSWRELILLEARHGRPAEVASWARRLRAAKRDDSLGTDDVHKRTDEALARWETASAIDRQRGVDVRVDPRDALTVELMWDTGWSYVDIHITEPGGEVVKWDNDTSKAGGRLTGGYIFGFGPEIYTIRNAPAGEFRLDIDYYASDQTNVSLETLAHVVVSVRGRRGNIERHEHFVVLRTDDEHRMLETIPVN